MRLSLMPVENLAVFISIFLLMSVPRAECQSSVHAVLKAVDQRKAAPELKLEDAYGKPLTLKQYAGRIVLLDFWATWCHGCQEEIPWFSEFEREYGSQGLTVVGVSLDEGGWKAVKPFIKTAGVPYRIVLGNHATSRLYSIVGMPDTFLLDRNGRVAAKYVGLVDKNDIEANIRTLLAEQ